MRLSIQKKTIANLQGKDMNTSKGGTGIGMPAPTFEPGCFTELCDWYTVIDCPSMNCQ